MKITPQVEALPGMTPFGFNESSRESLGDFQSPEFKAGQKRLARNKVRRERDQAMRDLGMVKVKGNLGGTYWE